MMSHCGFLFLLLLVIKKNRNDRNAILTSEGLYSVDFCSGPQIKVSYAVCHIKEHHYGIHHLDGKLPRLEIWRHHCICLRQLGCALVRPHMKRRADTATFRGPVQEAMTLLRVKKTAPADVTVQHSAGKSTRKKVLLFLPNTDKKVANVCSFCHSQHALSIA